ncbi:DUF4886 domain-containing protein [Belliella kenyensis]|uniref:DUF4886 domain-containing protein n=1 Tax=Belliella kenyensis TaxID=1472724 RepID=A0ABV8EPI0_9BACT|nr:DUF4886 domain-containing protein [Belliella kenyensis]MCH7402533.1 DUF4886 domain-containing protein [Belliella kenyensis]MDN3603331.1 DUF4886 domain-containing protein [Belliella kenyensis]
MKKLHQFSLIAILLFLAFPITSFISLEKKVNVIKILAIGNSFSEDAIENYLYDLAASENIELVIGNLYIGGASLDLHWQNAQENKAAYEYRKVTKQGKVVLKSTKIETAILDEDWDYISFQQVSNNSGKYETYIEPLSNLLAYTKSLATNSEAKYWLHQTWAYAENSTHDGFSNYNHDQETMYAAITNTARKVSNALGLDYVVPSGTAIQNARKTLLGDNFTRDGYHLSYTIGRYTAASTWFEALTGISVVGNSFGPSDMDETALKIAQLAAHGAILNPDEVTLLEEYLPELVVD